MPTGPGASGVLRWYSGNAELDTRCGPGPTREAHPAFAATICPASHARASNARQVAPRTGTTGARVAIRGCRAGSRPRAGLADSSTRAAPACRHGPSAPAAQPRKLEIHPSRGEAGGHATRWRSVHVCERQGPSLQRAQVPGVRPRSSGGPRWPLDGRWLETPLPCAQPTRRGMRVRQGVHAREAGDGTAPNAGRGQARVMPALAVDRTNANARRGRTRSGRSGCSARSAKPSAAAAACPVRAPR